MTTQAAFEKRNKMIAEQTHNIPLFDLLAVKIANNVLYNDCLAEVQNYTFVNTNSDTYRMSVQFNQRLGKNA